MQIQFGQLLDVLGKAVAHGGFTFVPALVQLAGNGFSTDYHLANAVGPKPPAILAHPLAHRYDAAWVRARLPHVFGFTPDLAQIEKTLLDVGFVSVPHQQTVGYPFLCTDYYGRTGLAFSREGPDEDLQAQIATAFWSLLLSEPEDLANFEATVFHPGGGYWMHFSCENGSLHYDESTDEP